MTSPHGKQRARQTKAFTAIEVTAVATILAILALLILPLLRGRVETARMTAAQDDLTQLAKGEMLAQADTERYYRLQDLDNTTVYDPADSPSNSHWTVAVPHSYWNETLASVDQRLSAVAGTERKKIWEHWQGPYCTLPRTDTAKNLLADKPELFWWRGGTGVNGKGGPILMADQDILEEEQLPIDPWGNPYIFFGSGKIVDSRSSNYPPPFAVVLPAIAGSETDFGNAVVYCTGPDGRPGDATKLTNPTDPMNYFRETRYLGAKPDDLEISF